MTPYPAARLCYVTHEDPDTFLLNIQFDPGQDRVSDVLVDGSRFDRIRLTREQVSNIVKDGVGVL
jgi:hypothetical protein